MYEINKANIFCDDLDGKTLEQFQQCLQYDWAVKGALMPDAHLGYSMPIGGVILTENVLVPAWVGYDIGCGVCAVPTTFPLEAIENNLEEIYGRVKQAVPMGFNMHDIPIGATVGLSLTVAGKEAHAKRQADHQLGTLGGGNHFIEVCRDESDVVWVVIHSGSRGVGHEIGGYYSKLAENHGLDGLGFEGGTQLFKDYNIDMQYCLKWALHNRKLMLKIIEQEIYAVTMGRFNWDQLINKNHNHAELMWKDGVGAVQFLHRKGATTASKGTLGVIPGNMAVGSFVVAGLGNEESLWSCSHGAGRAMSRGKAKKLDLEDFKESMQGVMADVSQRTIDESPGAYKDLGDVMYQQRDLCEPIHELKPIINWKG